MLKRIEIKNWENHKDTVIDFSAGFNLICGPSESGKTSVLRAIKLVAYNEWNPRSLRLGCSNCEITLTTDKGTVKVIRGGENHWEVTPNGKPTQTFDKPGKNVIPEAAEIVGLHAVDVGSHSIKPNFAEQLEGHFLLAEVGGDSVSASLRAQIIDEISGLSGMEELIRNVALDNNRNSRESGQIEKIIEGLEERKHDQDMIDKGMSRVRNAETKAKAAIEKAGTRDNAEVLMGDATTLTEELEGNRARVARIPDIGSADAKITKAGEVVHSGRDASELSTQHGELQELLSTSTERLKVIPDCVKALRLLSDASEKLSTCKEAKIVSSDATAATKGLRCARIEFKATPDTEKALRMLGNAEKKGQILRTVREFLSNFRQQNDKLVEIKELSAKIDIDCASAEKKLNEAMASVEICPICLEPVHEGCGAHKL